MNDPSPDRHLIVADRTGQTARIVPEVVDPEKIMLLLDEGQKVAVPRVLLKAQPNGTYVVPVAFSSFLDPTQIAPPNGAKVFPVAAEQVRIGKRKVETARVVVHKKVEEREEIVREPIWTEEVELKRVQVNKMVDEVPQPRQEGDVFVIPLVEEVLVLEKRLFLREEVHVLREKKPKENEERIRLRSEVIEVERLPIAGEEAKESGADA